MSPQKSEGNIISGPSQAAKLDLPDPASGSGRCPSVNDRRQGMSWATSWALLGRISCRRVPVVALTRREEGKSEKTAPLLVARRLLIAVASTQQCDNQSLSLPTLAQHGRARLDSQLLSRLTHSRFGEVQIDNAAPRLYRLLLQLIQIGLHVLQPLGSRTECGPETPDALNRRPAPRRSNPSPERPR